MAFPAKSGKKFNSKFRANRADKAAREGMEKTDGSNPGDATPEQKGGNRAKAAAIEAKPAANRSEAQAGAEPIDGAAGLAAQHGPASEVHIFHDHANGMHRVHSVHADGHQQQTEHGSADEAHVAGAAAGGVNPEGQYPEQHEHPEDQHKTPEAEPDEDDSYDVEPL